jgi:hypothetical protein
VRNTDLHEAQRRGAIGDSDLRILRARFGRRQLETHPRPINLSRDISPTGLHHYLRTAAQNLHSGSRGAAGAVGAKNGLAPIGIAIAESYPIGRNNLERKCAVGSDSASPVTQPPYEIGLVVEAPPPSANTKHEIIAGALELVEL